MPDELELLKTLLDEYHESLRQDLLSGKIEKVEFLYRTSTSYAFRIMIYKVRQQIKDFEDTVSGSGG